MNIDMTYPYSLEITPTERPEGHFLWAIRDRGKLIQRSDRAFANEQAARKRGEAELERLLSGRDKGR